jgi:hypothetical protein
MFSTFNLEGMNASDSMVKVGGYDMGISVEQDMKGKTKRGSSSDGNMSFICINH